MKTYRLSDRTALLLCNGEPPPRRLLRRLAKEADFVVCADGGANAARVRGVKPDLIIGDLDSVSPGTRRFFRDVPLIRVSRQDNTDLEKALEYLRSKRINSVVIAGATGRRLDMTLANLSVVWNYTRRMEITCVGEGWTAIPVTGILTMRARRGTIVSLVPFGACSGITLTGLRYPLRNARMRVGQTGVSNVVTRSPFRVTVNRGRMMVVVSGT